MTGIDAGVRFYHLALHINMRLWHLDFGLWKGRQVEYFGFFNVIPDVINNSKFFDGSNTLYVVPNLLIIVSMHIKAT